MGKTENALLGYYNSNRRFAELTNGWIFGGKNYVKPEDVTDTDRRQEHRGPDGKMTHQRYRDIAKEIKGVAIHLIVGDELQEHVDYTMPLRVMDMDLMGYLKQKNDISETYREKGTEGFSTDEFLSKFQQTDRLIPEITLVIYMGDRPWDGAKSLHELLNMSELPEEARGYIENYRLHILDVKHTPDEEFLKFPSDIRYLLKFIKNTKDKEALRRLMEQAKQEYVEKDTFLAILRYVDEPELWEWNEKSTEKEDEKNMCKAFREMVADLKMEGEQLGRLKMTINQVQKKIQKGKNLAEVAEEMEETEDNIKPVYETVKANPNDNVDELIGKLKKLMGLE